jgi:hypothetical protein
LLNLTPAAQEEKMIDEMKLTTDPKGAVCEDCRQPMLVADGCRLIPIPIYSGPEESGKKRKPITVLNPIRFGDEQQFVPRERCHDCGTTKGHYHHPGCDCEECPYCHGQLLQCGGEACESNGSLTPAARSAVSARKFGANGKLI